LFIQTKEPQPQTPRAAAMRSSRTRHLRLTLFAALAVLLVALPAAGAAATSSMNLVGNPSFETSLSGWGGYEAAIQRVSGGLDGAYAASVTAQRSASWSISPSPRQVPSVTAGTVYTGTAAVKARSGQKMVCLVMREWSGSTVVGSASSCLTPSSSWTTVRAIAYTAKSTGNSLDLYAYGRNGVSGSAFDVDAFSLTTGAEVSPGPAPSGLAVALTAPTAAKVAGTVETAASITSGTAARVEFLVDGTLIGSDSTSPYSVSWNSTTGGDRTVMLVARAVTSTGTSAESSRSLQVDNTAPATIITSAPAGTTSSTNAEIGFGANEQATFQCELNGSAWTSCTSPRTLSGLASGTHTFRVRAIDSLGHVDATPAVASWTISTLLAPSPTGCSVDTTTMTAPGCTIAREDSSVAADPRPGLWGSIECATSTRHQQVTAGGDTAKRANGASQSDLSYRSLTVVSGDIFYGQRCELGRNEWRNGENTGTQTSGAFALYNKGDRKITFFSQRYGAAFDPSVGTWQVVFQQKQAQPYSGNGPVDGAPAIELQIHGNKLHIANFWSTKWSTAAPRLGAWIRYALDVTYSSDASVGKIRLYADLNADGDWNDAGEVSPIISAPTLAYTTTSAYGLNAGDAIPGHPRIGLYHSPTISCPAPAGCRVDVDNVQIVR
jgi:hypothetical protein